MNGQEGIMNERTDDQLIATLGDAIIHADPVPEHVLAGARAAFTWRTIDAELAELVFDSANELTGVRSEASPRQVTFQAPGVEIEAMVIDNGQRRIVGQLIPPTEATVQLASGERSPRPRPMTSAGSRSTTCGPARCASPCWEPMARPWSTRNGPCSDWPA